MFAEAPLCLYYMLVRVSDLAYYEFLVVTYEHAVLAPDFVIVSPKNLRQRV